MERIGICSAWKKRQFGVSSLWPERAAGKMERKLDGLLNGFKLPGDRVRGEMGKEFLPGRVVECGFLFGALVVFARSREC